MSTGSAWLRRARLSLVFALCVVILGLGTASVLLDSLTHQPGTHDAFQPAHISIWLAPAAQRDPPG